MTPTCPYCNNPSKKVTGADIYPHRQDLWDIVIYECKPCDARVGCHKGTDKPLGRLADAELRKAKSAAHAAFDPIWKLNVRTRNGAYQWLAKKLGIRPKDCHIGMFDVETCHRVIQICEEEEVLK